MRKKEYLAQGMAMTGLHGLCSFLRALRPGELPILAYHRVCDIGDEAGFPFDPDLVSASCPAFAWQMRYLKFRGCKTVRLEDLVSCLKTGELLPRACEVIQIPALSLPGIHKKVFKSGSPCNSQV